MTGGSSMGAIDVHEDGFCRENRTERLEKRCHDHRDENKGEDDSPSVMVFSRKACASEVQFKMPCSNVPGLILRATAHYALIAGRYKG